VIDGGGKIKNKKKRNEQISQQLYVLYGRHRRGEKMSKILEEYKNIYQLGKGGEKKISDVTINTCIFRITWLLL
jgi:hypothetical protein